MDEQDELAQSGGKAALAVQFEQSGTGEASKRETVCKKSDNVFNNDYIPKSNREWTIIVFI